MHRELRIRVFMCGAVARAGTGVRAAAPDHRSSQDLEIEAFLREARIVARHEIGSGITRPSLLTLELGSTRRHAIFKSIDERVPGPTLDMSTHHIVTDFSDSWRHEVAAYRIDRALGIDLVPVTVARRAGGELGSAQIWVEGCVTFRELVDSGDVEIRGDEELLLRRLTWMYVFDELIANADRNWDNILLDSATDRFALIDHSRSFRLRSTVSPPTLPEPRRLSPAITSRLRDLDRRAIDELTGDLLTRSQIDAVVDRREALFEILDRYGLLPPD